MSNADKSLSEYDAIAKTVQIYIDGAKSGRGGDMQSAFHPDATIFGFSDGEIFAGPIQKLFQLSKQRCPGVGASGALGEHRHRRHDRRRTARTRELEWLPIHGLFHAP